MEGEGVRAACPVPFDEGRLWKGADGAALKAQLQRHFRNITAVMDCVGCEKCKLWGKLQLLGARPLAGMPTLTHPQRSSRASARLLATTGRVSAMSGIQSTMCTLPGAGMKLCCCWRRPAGIATSLKVLFSAEDCSGAATGEPQLRLERNEVRPTAGTATGAALPDTDPDHLPVAVSRGVHVLLLPGLHANPSHGRLSRTLPQAANGGSMHGGSRHVSQVSPAEQCAPTAQVIAMLNLLERLSASIETVRVMSLQLAGAALHPRGLGAIQDVTHESLQEAL